jgi:hypothetical protein
MFRVMILEALSGEPAFNVSLPHAIKSRPPIWAKSRRQVGLTEIARQLHHGRNCGARPRAKGLLDTSKASTAIHYKIENLTWLIP